MYKLDLFYFESFATYRLTTVYNLVDFYSFADIFDVI